MELPAVCTAARRVNVVYVQCSFMQYIFDEISDGVSCGQQICLAMMIAMEERACMLADWPPVLVPATQNICSADMEGKNTMLIRGSPRVFRSKIILQFGTLVKKNYVNIVMSVNSSIMGFDLVY